MPRHTKATKVAAIVKDDPAKMNELNQEPWYQSGVGFFGVGGVLWSLGAIFTQVVGNGLDFQAYDYSVMVTAIGALVTHLLVLWRRFWPNLRPMFWWWGVR